MFLCYVLVICMLPSSVMYAAAAELDADYRAVSVNTLNMIEQLNDEIVELRMERSEIEDEDSVRLSDIDSEISKKQKQIHLIFTSIGQDRNLHRSTSKKIYDSFEANSNECKKFINDLIKVYAAKVVNVIIGDSIINLAPWELLFNDKPQANQISSNGDALYATLNTVSVQKFVFVYDTSKDNWVYCLSTNKVSCSLSVTAALCIDGRAVNQSKDYGPTWIYGDWNNASKDADFGYNNGIEMQTCISEVCVESTSKNTVEVVNYIHTPKYVAHML